MYSIEDFRQDVRDYVEQDRWMADPDVVIDLFSKLIGTDITLDEATNVAKQEIPNPPLAITKELVVDLGTKNGVDFSKINL